MEQIVYNLKFSLPYVECSNFKEKDTLNLRNLIGFARLGREINFSSYGTITFDNDDKYHYNPIVTPLENYGRGKTNCLIYNVTKESMVADKFNKLIIFKTDYKNTGYYGYIMYNTETGRMSDILNVEFLSDALCIHIWKSFDTLTREDLYNYYLNRTPKYKKN